uniref:Uncharacterized protein n=1 Tax=Rangifer tarandus platyrhynchus TaxID=3082113 RepID=A0ACB0F850_RANTA|nr:unnamed protein product [Rangifer tarandus platyrhynchus]
MFWGPGDPTINGTTPEDCREGKGPPYRSGWSIRPAFEPWHSAVPDSEQLVSLPGLRSLTSKARQRYLSVRVAVKTELNTLRKSNWLGTQHKLKLTVASLGLAPDMPREVSLKFTKHVNACSSRLSWGHAKQSHPWERQRGGKSIQKLCSTCPVPPCFELASENTGFLCSRALMKSNASRPLPEAQCRAL